MEITYSRNGDYLLPDIQMDEQPMESIGKYGRMHKRFLKEHRKGTYNTLLLKGTLTAHLIEIDRTAREQVEKMIIGLEQNNPPPDKATDQMGWVAHMNALKHQAEEVVMEKLIYN